MFLLFDLPRFFCFFLGYSLNLKLLFLSFCYFKKNSSGCPFGDYVCFLILYIKGPFIGLVFTEIQNMYGYSEISILFLTLRNKIFPRMSIILKK